MKRSLRVLLAAVAVLAALCVSAWADTTITPGNHDSKETWETGTYTLAAGQTATFKERITVSGDVVLILNDGCELNATKGITVASNDKGVNSLTIEGGPLGTGTLIATSNSNLNAAIGGEFNNANAGKITINGGVVTANGDSGSSSAAIGGGEEGSGGEITINGGVVTAMNVQGDNRGAAIGSGLSNGGTVSGGVIKITGGKVTAHALNGAAIGGGAPESGTSDKISGGTIIMTGGIVEATSVNGDGIGYGAGSTGSDRGTLSSDQGGRAWIVASSIMATTNDFKVGVIFDTQKNSGNGEVYGDMTIPGDVEIPAGKTLTVPTGKSLTIPKDMSMAMQDGSKLTIETGAKLTIAAEAKFDASNGTVDNKGTIENEGAMDAGTKGKIVNSGTILNKGEMGAADGTIENSGTIENEADAKLDATTGKIVNTGTINNKGTMDAASDAIDNKGTILNDGTLNLPEGTSADVIKALKLTGSGKVMAGEKEYSNDGTPADGGPEEDDPQGGEDQPNVADYISLDVLPGLPYPDSISMGINKTITSVDVDAVIDAAPSLEDTIEEANTPFGKAPTVAPVVAVSLAKRLTGDRGIKAEAITLMPIRTTTISSEDLKDGKTDAVIVFQNLRFDDLVSSDVSVDVANLVVIKVKSEDGALRVRAATDPSGGDFENGCFMITDANNEPLSKVDPKGGLYNMLIRVTDLKDKEDLGDSTNFDVDPNLGTVVDPIIVLKEARVGGSSSGGGCDAGLGIAAAFGLAAIAIRRRGR